VRTGLDLIQLDAVVVDKKGNYVTDLGPDDFAIFEDGHSRKVSNVTYVRLATAPASAIETTPTESPASAPIATRAPALQREEVRRTIVLVVDDLNMDLWSMSGLRGSLRSYVERHVEPGDLVSIVLTGRGSGSVQDFGNDKVRLLEAVDRVRFNPAADVDVFAPIQSMPGLGSATPITLRDGGAASALAARGLMNGTIGTLRFVLDGLRDMPGRKSLVFFSRGYALRENSEPTDWGRALSGLIDVANRSSTVIYAVDPTPVHPRTLTAADNLLPPGYDNRTDEQFAGILMGQASARLHAIGDAEREGVSRLAEATGGLALRGGNHPAVHIERVLSDQRGYYLIGYVPIGSSFDQEAGRPMFHRVKIEVRRKGLKVRTRSGFHGVTDDDPRFKRDRQTMALRMALLSPFAAGGVPVRLNSLFFDDASRGLLLRSFANVGVQGLTLATRDDGSRAARVEILAVTFDADGRPVDQVNRIGELVLPRDASPERERRGFQYWLDVPVKKPGAYQLRIALRDVASDRIGSAYQFVSVPNLDKKRLTLSGILLTADHAAGAAPEADEPVRADYAFAPGESLAYGFAVYNATPGAGALESQMRLFRDDGREVLHGEPRRIEAPGPGALAGGTFALPESLAPGAYLLHLSVSDPQANKQRAAATQAVSFEVAP
jgi:VWFA-related protein